MTLLQERLFAMQDKQYAAFQAKLTPGVPMESFIGIRVPVLRKFAKEFTKETECKEFLHQLPHEYYDENMLHGLLISEAEAAALPFYGGQQYAVSLIFVFSLPFYSVPQLPIDTIFDSTIVPRKGKNGKP